jgi:2-amino-4-hydroxy-6-hydroxymethyldihydropteridine diphosphokinase
MRIGIALGSNVGDRLRHLQQARDALSALAQPGETLLQAPVYQTAPVACPDGSPDFLNTVISYPGDPLELLGKTQALELELGRVRTAERNAPRVIDIDLLYAEDTRLESEHLILPHPRLHLRRFVLEPLAVIRPNLILPGDRFTIAEHLAALSSSEPPLQLVTQPW